MRSSKDIARRLRFDRFPRGDTFRRWYLPATAACVALGLGFWLWFSTRWSARQYLPGPVATAHATFGDRCERCHGAFQAVADRSCLECHATRSHSEFDSGTPRCAECHVEHRAPAVFAAVSNRFCVDCHGALRSKRQPQAQIQPAIHTFAEHPQFAPLREGQADRGVVRFNHKLHLTSERIAKEDTLSCAKCHLPQPDGRLMQPITFEAHCKRCHEQKPPLDVGPIEAPHKEPQIVRDSIAAQLLGVAVQAPEPIFAGRKSTLPGIYDREPISAARTLRAFQEEWLGKTEAALYKPFDGQKPLLETNKYCFLCHDPEGTRDGGALPKIRPTAIASRWLMRGGFSHRRHDMMECVTCHEHVRDSTETADVNLPKREICQRCHADGVAQSAGTQCMLCHLYHDTSKQPDVRTAKGHAVKLDVLLGR